jgi:hypothetical protein
MANTVVHRVRAQATQLRLIATVATPNVAATSNRRQTVPCAVLNSGLTQSNEPRRKFMPGYFVFEIEENERIGEIMKKIELDTDRKILLGRM